jgi:hypothetical protein
MARAGQFAKGNDGKPKGATNKVTQEARELFLITIENEVPHLSKAFEEVREKSPKDYLDLIAKYAQYFVPKKTQTDNNTNVSINDFNLKDVIKFDNTKQ